MGPQYYQPPMSLGPDSCSYRQPPLAPYQCPIRAYYDVPSYGDFADENVDHGLHNTSYPLLGTENLGIPSYASSGTGRLWTTAPQLVKSEHTLFLEQEPSYNHDLYHTNNFPMRSMVSSETNNMSLNSIANALPAPIPDRILPYPSAGRQSQGSFLRSGEGHSMVLNNQAIRNADGIHSYHDGLMSPEMASAVKTLNSNFMSDNSPLPPSYPPLTNSGQQQTETYTMGNGNGLYRQQNDSSSSVSNDYSPSSRKASEASDHSSPATTLSNGHTYIPYISNSYPRPPMEQMPVALAIRRSSDAGIQAS